MAGEAREKCAVALAVGDGASNQVAEMLLAMQHRGDEASGMASLVDGKLETNRDLGMAKDVHTPKELARLAGDVAIGHNQYSTYARGKHPQPYKDSTRHFALGHNGNLPVTERLEKFLSVHSVRTDDYNDSEMMGLAISQYIGDGFDLPTAVDQAYPLFRGAFSSVAMQDDVTVAFRDPKGIRPLAIGRSEKDGYVVASETCGLDIVDATYEREVEPGEMVIITKGGLESVQIQEGTPKLDMFEFVYFARHDSQLYGQRVNEVRRRFGQQLADEHHTKLADLKNPIVVPVPDTSAPAAEGYSERSAVPRVDAVIKNRYVGRTFMQPSQKDRTSQLRRKHNVIPEAIEGHDVILIDDSIVRLNTLPRLVRLALESGANTVSVLIASPPVRFPDFYGIDTPSQDELAAARMTPDQMREEIGAHYLGFLSLGRLIEATKVPEDMFNLSCFTGRYPIGIGNRKNEVSRPISMEYID